MANIIIDRNRIPTMPCLICNEPIKISEYTDNRLRHEQWVNPKICDKCKQAILKVREVMEKQTD